MAHLQKTGLCKPTNLKDQYFLIDMLLNIQKNFFVKY